MSIVRVLIIAAAALCAAAGRGETTRAEKIRAKLESSDRNYVFVVMHRGDWRHAPENSVGAIKGSIEHGADIIELDVAKTKDGRYVLLHDNVIDRVTDGKGACSDYMLEDPAGSFSLEIPAYWYCSDSTAATALPVPNTQTTWLYSNGTMRISKCGVTWERDLDGTERQILEN